MSGWLAKGSGRADSHDAGCWGWFVKGVGELMLMMQFGLEKAGSC